MTGKPTWHRFASVVAAQGFARARRSASPLADSRRRWPALALHWQRARRRQASSRGASITNVRNMAFRLEFQLHLQPDARATRRAEWRAAPSHRARSLPRAVVQFWHTRVSDSQRWLKRCNTTVHTHRTFALAIARSSASAPRAPSPGWTPIARLGLASSAEPRRSGRGLPPARVFQAARAELGLPHSPLRTRAQGAPRLAAPRALQWRVTMPPDAPPRAAPWAGTPLSSAYREQELSWRSSSGRDSAPTRLTPPSGRSAIERDPAPPVLTHGLGVIAARAAQAPAELDARLLDRLTDDVIRRVERRARVERERRGL